MDDDIFPQMTVTWPKAITHDELRWHTGQILVDMWIRRRNWQINGEECQLLGKSWGLKHIAKPNSDGAKVWLTCYVLHGNR